MSYTNLCRRFGTLRGFATSAARRVDISTTNYNKLHEVKLPEHEDKDIFGTLSRTGTKSLEILSAEENLPDDRDGYDKEEFSLEPKKNRYYYKYEISKYARQGSLGLQKALHLFHTMKQHDRITPMAGNFSALIYGCAKAGYTKKAFELYDESLKYTSKVSLPVVTCLINACAESQFKEYGIERLNWLRSHLKIDLNYSLNQIQYRCAIKAYGKLGQLEEASSLVKEMMEEGFMPDTDTFNMLLIGCASNKESGSTIALRLYKRLKLYGLKPSLVTYRLLLRCIRDCDIGSKSLVEQTLMELPAMTSHDQLLKYKKSSKKRMNDRTRDFEWLPLISELSDSLESVIKDSPSSDQKSSEQTKYVKLIDDRKQSFSGGEQAECDLILMPNYEGSEVQPSSLVSPSGLELPNLLSDNHLELMNRIRGVQFDKISGSPERLQLFGGLYGFIDTMLQNGCKPDIKVFSLLLGCIKRCEEDQREYLSIAKRYIKRDQLFYDLLLRHIGTSFYKNRMSFALSVLDEMHMDNIRPNITTFESLAASCSSWRQASQLLKDVKRCGFAESHIMTTRFFKAALASHDFGYLNEVIEYSRKIDYQPSRSLVDSLESRRLDAHQMILRFEKSRFEENERLPKWLNESNINNYDKFNRNLGSWLSSVKLREDEHPWAQFHIESGSKRTGFEEFVNKFKALEKVKREIQERGGSFGNLMIKSEKKERRQLADKEDRE